MDSLKRKESTGCDTKIVSRKVADAKGDKKSLVDGLRRDTFDSYASVRNSLDYSLVEVSKRLKEMFDPDAMVLQQCVNDALHSAEVMSKSRLAMPLRLQIEE